MIPAICADGSSGWCYLDIGHPLLFKERHCRNFLMLGIYRKLEDEKIGQG